MGRARRERGNAAAEDAHGLADAALDSDPPSPFTPAVDLDPLWVAALDSDLPWQLAPRAGLGPAVAARLCGGLRSALAAAMDSDPPLVGAALDSDSLASKVALHLPRCRPRAGPHARAEQGNAPDGASRRG